MNYWMANKLFNFIGPIKVRLFGGIWSKEMHTYDDGEYLRFDGTATFQAGFIKWTGKMPYCEEAMNLKILKAA